MRTAAYAYALGFALCGCASVPEHAPVAGDPRPAPISVPSMDAPPPPALPPGEPIVFMRPQAFAAPGTRPAMKPRRALPLLIGIGRGRAGFALVNDPSHPIVALGDLIGDARVVAIGESEVRLADGRTLRINVNGSVPGEAGPRSETRTVVPDIVDAGAATASPQPEASP